jgi:hypothetical protein
VNSLEIEEHTLQAYDNKTCLGNYLGLMMKEVRKGGHYTAENLVIYTGHLIVSGDKIKVVMDGWACVIQIWVGKLMSLNNLQDQETDDRITLIVWKNDGTN